MKKAITEKILLEDIDDRLRRIANFLLLNASYIDNLGLINGKMGIAIFFYYYSRYTQNKIFEGYAGELIDEIYEEINVNTPVNFSDGLTGIGWGIEYLVKHKFIEGDTDDILSEIDNNIYKHMLNSPILIDASDDFFGYGYYYIARLAGHKIDDNDLKALIKKYNLIYLTDECERLLIHKRYLDFNILSLKPVTINSVLWFLIEMYILQLYPVKVNKILLHLPEYLGFCKSDDPTPVDKLTLHSLSIRLCEAVKEEKLRILYKSVAFQHQFRIEDIDNDEDFVNVLGNSAIQKMIYNHGVSDKKQPGLFRRAFNIIDNEDNWNQRIDQVNKSSLGLSGFAGLGFCVLDELGINSFGRHRKSNNSYKDV
ncbi:MAG TPA: hypothetical protein PLX41_09445 [Bacteroidales bacterium]|nr:hypothetical protein [Bacteroidales bacterium]